MATTEHRALNPPQLRTPPGPWSNAIEVKPGARYLFTCGLVGVRQDGTIEEKNTYPRSSDPTDIPG